MRFAVFEGHVNYLECTFFRVFFFRFLINLPAPNVLLSYRRRTNLKKNLKKVHLRFLSDLHPGLLCFCSTTLIIHNFKHSTDCQKSQNCQIKSYTLIYRQNGKNEYAVHKFHLSSFTFSCSYENLKSLNR